MIVEKLWVELSLRAQRISNTLTDVLLDGLYLATFPVLGILLSPLALVAGFLSGWLHPGFKTVFSESMPFMIFAGSIGILSGRLGLLFTIGFAVGDFFFAAHAATNSLHGPIRNFLETRPALFIEYALLGMLLVGVPMMVKQVLSTLHLPKSLTDKQVFLLALLGWGIFTGLFVFFWTQAVPVLMRPVFTWDNNNPPIAMAQPLQTSGFVLVVVLVIASLVRSFLQHTVITVSSFASIYIKLSKQLFTAKPLVPFTAQIPPLVFAITSSVWLVFLFSGILTAWIQAIILVVIFSFFAILREGIISLPLGRLPLLIYRVPYIARFIGGMLLVVWVANQAVARRSGNDTFEPIIITVGIALAIFFILNPPYIERDNKA